MEKEVNGRLTSIVVEQEGLTEVCPDCGSFDLKYDVLLSELSIFAPNWVECNNCGKMFLRRQNKEIEEEIK